MSDVESSVLIALEQVQASPGEHAAQICVATALLAWLQVSCMHLCSWAHPRDS
jgi:hypothetical protein